MLVTKCCPKCHSVKELSAFAKHSCSKSGVSSWCKVCLKALNKDYRIRNKTRRKQYLRQWREEHYDLHKESVRRYKSKNKAAVRAARFRCYYKNIGISRMKRRARAAVERALKRGAIIKPLVCSFCGLIGRLHAHHHDYNSQLDISWLCQSCHKYVHIMEGG